MTHSPLITFRVEIVDVRGPVVSEAREFNTRTLNEIEAYTALMDWVCERGLKEHEEANIARHVG